MVLRLVRPVDLLPALALLRGPQTAVDMSAPFFQQLVRGERPLAQLIGAYDGATLRGVVYAEAVAGASAVLWPPQTNPPDAALADVLVQEALAHVAEAKMVQAFLTPDEWAQAASLLRQGFRHVTNVWQLEWHGSATAAPALQLQPITDTESFQDILIRCHDDSQDCPELNGVRSPPEVVAGYREAAPDLAQWLVASVDRVAVGVAIRDGDEIHFLGVLPEQRRRGYGRRLLHALAQTSPKMTLIVDERNTPALELYQSFGFIQTAQRAVLLYLR